MAAEKKKKKAPAEDALPDAGRAREAFLPALDGALDGVRSRLRHLSSCPPQLMHIEGGRAETDARRGSGVYDKVIANMERLHEKGPIFGASVTVTKENLAQVASPGFLDTLSRRGCKAVFYIEYVPVTPESRDLAPEDEDRACLAASIEHLRRTREDMLFISFPGDEKTTGGCLAAGRGFFHINSHGGAEPCPFSAWSDINVKDASLKDAIASGLFAALRSENLLEEDHAGGCVLFEKRERVEQIVRSLSEQKA